MGRKHCTSRTHNQHYNAHTHTVLRVSVKWPHIVQSPISHHSTAHTGDYTMCAAAYSGGWHTSIGFHNTLATHSYKTPPSLFRSNAVKASAGSPWHAIGLLRCLHKSRVLLQKSDPISRGCLCVAPTQNARIPRPCPQSVASCCARRQPILLCPFDPLTSSCPPK